MFIHSVLFKIAPKEVLKYRKDSLMWANFAKKHSKGFISYFTMKGLRDKNQYASIYTWKAKIYHDSFMAKYHDLLVSRSKAKVKVLGYYDLLEKDKLC